MIFIFSIYFSIFIRYSISILKIYNIFDEKYERVSRINCDIALSSIESRSSARHAASRARPAFFILPRFGRFFSRAGKRPPCSSGNFGASRARSRFEKSCRARVCLPSALFAPSRRVNARRGISDPGRSEPGARNGVN